MTKRRKKRKRLKKSVKLIIFTLIIIAISFTYINTIDNDIINGNKETTEQKELLQKQEKAKKYQECMSNPYQEEGLEEKFNNLFNQYSNEVSIVFTDINNNYSYSKNPNKGYYSASAIKLFDTIYLVENNIDINNTITYTPNYRLAGSDKTASHKLYEQIPIKNLIDYELSISDNAAHAMLVDYIDAKNMNQYFKENGNINLGLSNSKPYCYNYTANIANVSLQRIYNIIKEENEVSNIIKNAMNNDYENGLSFDDITIFHKYGLYGYVYHDIGIYMGDNPYLVSILTNYGNNADHKDKIQSIHKELYNIYLENLTNKETYCKTM